MQRASPRRSGPRLPVAPARALVGWGALFVLALATYWTVRLAWADHLSRSPNLENRRRAARLAPLDASIWKRLAEGLEAAGANPLPALERAAGLDPDNPEWRADLGQQAEVHGDLALAESSLLAASRLSRLYQPRYLLAGYYLRRGNADLCLRWSRESLVIAPGDVRPVLSLMDRLLDSAAMAEEGLRQPPAVARQFLNFLAERGPAAATGRLARHLAEKGPNEDLPAVLGYINQLLAAGRAAEAVELWDALCGRRLLPYTPLDAVGGRSLTNADFRLAPIESGFDWHAEGAPGLGAVRFEGALRATFSGDQPDDCVIVWEYVPLEAGSRYRLRADVRAEDSEASRGLQWRLFYPGNGPAWGPLEGDLREGFRAPTPAARLALMYRRPAGSRRLAGEFSVTGLRLDREP